MTTEPVRGTSRERATVVAMILVSLALPVMAKLPLFQDVVWVFWLAALALMVGALAVIVAVNRRERRTSDS